MVAQYNTRVEFCPCPSEAAKKIDGTCHPESAALFGGREISQSGEGRESIACHGGELYNSTGVKKSQRRYGFNAIRILVDRQPCLSLVTLILCAVCISPQAAFGQAEAEAKRYAEQGRRHLQAGDLHTAEFELRRAVELAPKDFAYLAELGVILGKEQKLAESNQYFQKALQLQPQSIPIRRNLAANQWRLGQLDKAENNLEQILKANPRDEDTILLLGTVEESLKHYAAAARLLASVPDLLKQHPESVAALARSYYRTQNRSNARATLRSLLDARFEPQEVYLGGQIAMEEEDFTTAEELFASIQQSYSDAARLGYDLAFTRYRTGKFRECQDTLLAVMKASPATADLDTLLGWCYARQEKLKEAVDAFNQAVALDPSRESTYLDLGTILIHHKLIDAALKQGRETAERFPTSYHAFMLKGMTEAYFGEMADAVKSFARAVELNPDSAEANDDLATVQSEASLKQQAMETWERGIKRFPTDALQFQHYASFLVKLGQGDDSEAESRAFSVLATAIALDSTLAEPHYLLGILELKNSQADRAAQQLELAAKLQPASSRIHLALSRAYSRLGREDKATAERKIYEKSAKEELREGRWQIGTQLRLHY